MILSKRTLFSGSFPCKRRTIEREPLDTQNNLIKKLSIILNKLDPPSICVQMYSQ